MGQMVDSEWRWILDVNGGEWWMVNGVDGGWWMVNGVDGSW